ncbi:MAG: hypothetical protein KGL39_12950 [Patescibacteria group bacterium]|nr:hypothetical protein [Patescibacteria group bacterium]
MAATIAYAAPRWIPSGPVQVPNIYQIAANGGQTLIEGDIAILSSNKLSKAAANAAVSTIAGLVQAGTTTVYYNASPSTTTLFGYDQSGNALIPATNQNPRVLGFTPGMLFEMSLNQATTLATSLIGTSAGLNYDSTSGFFFVDTTQTNKIFTIVQISGGPDSLFPAYSVAGAANGVIGDSGGRVIVAALSGAALV